MNGPQITDMYNEMRRHNHAARLDCIDKVVDTLLRDFRRFDYPDMGMYGTNGEYFRMRFPYSAADYMSSSGKLPESSRSYHEIEVEVPRHLLHRYRGDGRDLSGEDRMIREVLTLAVRDAIEAVDPSPAVLNTATYTARTPAAGRVPHLERLQALLGRMQDDAERFAGEEVGAGLIDSYAFELEEICGDPEETEEDAMKKLAKKFVADRVDQGIAITQRGDWIGSMGSGMTTEQMMQFLKGMR